MSQGTESISVENHQPSSCCCEALVVFAGPCYKQKPESLPNEMTTKPHIYSELSFAQNAFVGHWDRSDHNQVTEVCLSSDDSVPSLPSELNSLTLIFGDRSEKLPKFIEANTIMNIWIQRL